MGELVKPKFIGKIKTEMAMNKIFFYDENDEVVNPVNAIAGLEVGDVVWIKYTGYDKLHTVELLEEGYMIVNYEHSGSRGDGSLKLENKTNVSATVELLTKWYNAPLGLGQAWVDVTTLRGTVGSRANVLATNTTGRSMEVIASAGEERDGQGQFYTIQLNTDLFIERKYRCSGSVVWANLRSFDFFTVDNNAVYGIINFTNQQFQKMVEKR